LKAKTKLKEKFNSSMKLESPEYVRISLAAAMTLGLIPGKFFRNAKLYCVNLLLTYNEGCVGRCAYCGLSKSRTISGSWNENSFIRVDWPVIALDEIIIKLKSGFCSHVERVCVSMITNKKACEDTLKIVSELHKNVDLISALVTPMIIDKRWLYNLKESGTDMVGIAVDAATPELFEKLRGQGVGGAHKWSKYWRIIKEALEVFGKNKVGIHLMVGVGETEEEMVKTIQRTYNLGAQVHLFSFFPEKESLMKDVFQPNIGSYRRIQLARYLIQHRIISAKDMEFSEKGRLKNFGIRKIKLDEIINNGVSFMTSGCPGKTMNNSCNRPFANCSPYQAYMGEMRNFPFKPNASDTEIIKKQLQIFSDHSKKKET
jgi:biotin synthase